MRWRLIVPLHHGRHLNDTLATIEVLPEAVTATNNKVNDVLDGASGAVPTTPLRAPAYKPCSLSQR
jgi:hypothetical protein